MRLWHYKLIPVLPKKMLISQWREIIAIKRQWEKGTLKHKLVSYVLEEEGRKPRYDTYIDEVVREMEKRGINYKKTLLTELKKFTGYYETEHDKNMPGMFRIGRHALSYKQHNFEYFKICYYNLKEKYLRGIVSEEDWIKIKGVYENENKYIYENY